MAILDSQPYGLYDKWAEFKLKVKIDIFNCNWLKTKLCFITKLDLGLCLPNRNVHQVHSFFKSTEGKIWFGPLFTFVRSALYRFPFSVNSFYHHRLSILG